MITTRKLSRQDALSYFVFREQWEYHCLEVGKKCERLAKQINGLDPEFAFIYGLVHDLGRITPIGKSNPKTHPLEGYKLLVEKGYPVEAMSCVTHSFPDIKDITAVPGMCHPNWYPGCDPDSLVYDEIDTEIRQILSGYEPTFYDKLVTLSDLMSVDATTVSIEERLRKVYEKYGTKQNRGIVSQRIFELKREIENAFDTKIDIYDLFRIEKTKHS